MQTSSTYTHPNRNRSPFRRPSTARPANPAIAWISALLLAAAASQVPAAAQTAGIYSVTPIVSDIPIPGATPTVDPGFVDPWGVAGGNTLWIDTAVTGFSYVTSVAGAISTAIKAVVPPASGTGTGQPTGTVQNTTTGFVLSNGAKASFLFATLDGTISGWNSATTANHAVIAVNNSSANAVYTDLALVTNPTGTFLLAPNFGQGGKVEIYNISFQPATLAGTFTDPTVPTGYAPYAIKVVGTQVFVTYMLRTTPPFAAGAGTYQEILGTNTGFVSVFDVNGNFVARAVTGGDLNAPWGVAIAPAGFGIYGGALLIGNFGDGLITAYNPTTYAYLGTVADGTGKPIAYPGLWDIFVPTATAALPNAIYFTAGLDGETHGLFGAIANGATTAATPTFNLSASTQVAFTTVGSYAGVTVSIAPTNGFTGTVTLACSGLPAGASCTLPSAPLAVLPTAPTTAFIRISTTANYGRSELPGFGDRRALGIVSAVLLPVGSLLLFGRRRRLIGLRILGCVLLLCGSASLEGCAYSGTAATPAGTSNVTVTATSGSISQTTTVALTVK